MLTVKTFVNQTKNKGLGLFTLELIPKHSIYWVRDSEFDLIINKEAVSMLKTTQINFLNKYGFLENNGDWYICMDGARYINHSTTPNTKDSFNNEGLITSSYAIKDIEIGQEILCNYVETCIHCKRKIDFIVKN